jgi:GNAT superfamily N-acetyltransferase
MTVTIRTALVADTAAIGRVHSLVWHETYTGKWPQQVLDTVGSPESRTEKRRKIFEFSTAKHGHLVVEAEDGRILGFSDCGPALEVQKFAPAEVTTLYVLKEAHGQGLGREMLRRQLQHLARVGYKSAALKVFLGNDKARAFYESCGGVYAGEAVVDFGGSGLPSAIYLWAHIQS